MTDGVDHRINVVVAKLLGHFRTFVFGRKCQIIHADAESIHDNFHRGALARAGIAHVDTLASKRFKAVDAAVAANDQSEGFWVNRHHRA